jgi:hypothetical protein
VTSEQKRIRDGCRCGECFWLAEHMILTTGRDFGLPRAPRPHDQATLRVVTANTTDGISFTGPLEKPCTGGMTCDCKHHRAERAGLVKRGPRETARQPWEPRPARRAA